MVQVKVSSGRVRAVVGARKTYEKRLKFSHRPPVSCNFPRERFTTRACRPLSLHTWSGLSGQLVLSLLARTQVHLSIQPIEEGAEVCVGVGKGRQPPARPVNAVCQSGHDTVVKRDQTLSYLEAHQPRHNGQCESPGSLFFLLLLFLGQGGCLRVIKLLANTIFIFTHRFTHR